MAQVDAAKSLAWFPYIELFAWASIVPEDEMISRTPPAPYYAVIFSIVRAKVDEGAHAATGEQMATLAAQQDGFLGFEYSPETPEGFSLSVSYWRDEESIRRWKQNAEHLVAQGLGKEKWYPQYLIRVARVERDYSQGV